MVCLITRRDLLSVFKIAINHENYRLRNLELLTWRQEMCVCVCGGPSRLTRLLLLLIFKFISLNMWDSLTLSCSVCQQGFIALWPPNAFLTIMPPVGSEHRTRKWDMFIKVTATCMMINLEEVEGLSWKQEYIVIQRSVYNHGNRLRKGRHTRHTHTHTFKRTGRNEIMHTHSLVQVGR